MLVHIPRALVDVLSGSCLQTIVAWCEEESKQGVAVQVKLTCAPVGRGGGLWGVPEHRDAAAHP